MKLRHWQCRYEVWPHLRCDDELAVRLALSGCQFSKKLVVEIPAEAVRPVSFKIRVTASDYTPLLAPPNLAGSTALGIVLRAALEHEPDATAGLKRLLLRRDETVRTEMQ